MTRLRPTKVRTRPDTNISAFIYPTLCETEGDRQQPPTAGRLSFFMPRPGGNAHRRTPVRRLPPVRELHGNRGHTATNGARKRGSGPFFNTENAIFPTDRTVRRK